MTKFKVGDKVQFVSGDYKTGEGIVIQAIDSLRPTGRTQYYIKWENNFGSMWYEGEGNLELIKQKKKLKVI